MYQKNLYSNVCQERDNIRFCLHYFLPFEDTEVIFFQVLENHVTPISSTNLAYQDSDTEDKDIIFSIIKPLAPGEGTLESVSHPFTPIARFSQEDINNNRILYRPPVKELGAQEREFFFTFTGIYSS